MFTNERLFTIQAFTITRVHCIFTSFCHIISPLILCFTKKKICMFLQILTDQKECSKVNLSLFYYSRGVTGYLKLGWASSNAHHRLLIVHSILPKIGWAIAHPARWPVTPLYSDICSFLEDTYVNILQFNTMFSKEDLESIGPIFL